MEVFKMLPEGTRCELIENKLYMSPAPSSLHQRIIYRLVGQYYAHLEKTNLGEFLPSPIDVFLNEKNAFQPDIVFISQKNASIVKDDGVHGAPDMIIEVLSKGTKNFDVTKKKKAYEQAGVKEFWLTEPSTKVCSGFKLEAGKFKGLGSQKAKLTSPLLKHTFKI